MDKGSLIDVAKFHTTVERATGKKLIAIWTDNSPEFANTLWAAYMKEHGIMHEFTTPYMPQQDGQMEWGHQMMRDHAWAMLFGAGVPEYMWGEAYITTMYLKNLTPCTLWVVPTV